MADTSRVSDAPDAPDAPDALAALAAAALGASGVGHGDVYLRQLRRGVARFSQNTLSQHAALDEPQGTVRAAVQGPSGWHLGSVTTSDLSREGLVAALRRAEAFARRAPALVDWPGFAPPGAASSDPPRWTEATAGCTAEARATALASVFARAREAGVMAAGLFETSAVQVAVANTAGTVRSARGTVATFKVFAVDADGVSGFAQATHRDVNALDVEGCARKSVSRCVAGRDPVALPAGEYDVVLEPTAVTELLEWMGFVTFGANAVHEGTSALAGRIGEAVTGPRVTLVDDATEPGPLGFGLPFDREGVLRRRVALIERGVARGPVYDRLWAARMGAESTGHAAPPGSDPPTVVAVGMEGGTDTVEDLYRRVARGLHITRFHYVNGYLDPRRALMTGLTRDGTFLIEGGERTRGVRNLRFTDSVLEAFARIDGVTALREAAPTWGNDAGAFVAPTLLVRGLRFTGGAAAAG